MRGGASWIEGLRTPGEASTLWSAVLFPAALPSGRKNGEVGWGVVHAKTEIPLTLPCYLFPGTRVRTHWGHH